jgi:hypothetical protein
MRVSGVISMAKNPACSVHLFALVANQLLTSAN